MHFKPLKSSHGLLEITAKASRRCCSSIDSGFPDGRFPSCVFVFEDSLYCFDPSAPVPGAVLLRCCGGGFTSVLLLPLCCWWKWLKTIAPVIQSARPSSHGGRRGGGGERRPFLSLFTSQHLLRACKPASVSHFRLQLQLISCVPENTDLFSSSNRMRLSLNSDYNARNIFHNALFQIATNGDFFVCLRWTALSLCILDKTILAILYQQKLKG